MTRATAPELVESGADVSSHSLRALGIPLDMQAGGTLDKAHLITRHANAEMTGLKDGYPKKFF